MHKALIAMSALTCQRHDKSCVPVVAEASSGGLQTLFTMIAGGLAGESPHMVAASVMALARLLYEFGGALSGALSFLHGISAFKGCWAPKHPSPQNAQIR